MSSPPEPLSTKISQVSIAGRSMWVTCGHELPPRRLEADDPPLHEPEVPPLGQPRRARNRGLRALAYVVRGVLRGHGAASVVEALPRSRRQRRKLRAGELSLGDEATAGAQSPRQREAHHSRPHSHDPRVGAARSRQCAHDWSSTRTRLARRRRCFHAKATRKPPSDRRLSGRWASATSESAEEVESLLAKRRAAAGRGRNP